MYIFNGVIIVLCRLNKKQKLKPVTFVVSVTDSTTNLFKYISCYCGSYCSHKHQFSYVFFTQKKTAFHLRFEPNTCRIMLWNMFKCCNQLFTSAIKRMQAVLDSGHRPQQEVTVLVDIDWNMAYIMQFNLLHFIYLVYS